MAFTKDQHNTQRPQVINNAINAFANPISYILNTVKPPKWLEDKA